MPAAQRTMTAIGRAGNVGPAVLRDIQGRALRTGTPGRSLSRDWGRETDVSEMLIASSPVEIEASADEAGLDPGARVAALHLFHDLTSRLELSSPALAAEGGEDWPRHRFYFGVAAGSIAGLLEALRTGPQTAEVTASGPAADEAARTLFIAAGDGDSGACSSPAPTPRTFAMSRTGSAP